VWPSNVVPALSHSWRGNLLSLKNIFFKVQVVTGFFFIMEDILTIKNKPHLINTMLSNLSELQTSTLFHGRIFKKMHLQHKWKSLAKAHGNTHLIKSLRPILDYFQPTLLICDSGILCGALKVNNNPSKTYIRNIVKLRERSIGITETRQKGHQK
jgi:hypothetical protein